MPTEAARPHSSWRDAAHYIKRAALGTATRTLAGTRFRLAYEARHLRDEADYALISRLATGKLCILDIGANVGATSLIMANAMARGGTLVAIEPSEASCLIIQENARLNEFADRIRIVNAVVGCDVNRSVAFHWNTISPRASCVAAQPSTTSKVLRKAVLTVDELVSELAIVPDFIKIDVEGAEADVLDGMRQTLERIHARHNEPRTSVRADLNRADNEHHIEFSKNGTIAPAPVVLIELHAWPGRTIVENADRVLAIAASAGFTATRLDTQSRVTAGHELADLLKTPPRSVQARAHLILTPHDSRNARRSPAVVTRAGRERIPFTVDQQATSM